MQVTAIVYANPSWRPADGGKLRIWLPRTASYQDCLAASSGNFAASPTGSHSDAGTRGNLLLHRHSAASQSGGPASLQTQGTGSGLSHLESLAAVDELGPIQRSVDSPPPSNDPSSHTTPHNLSAANGHLQQNMGLANGHLDHHAPQQSLLNGHSDTVTRRLSSEEGFVCDQRCL